VSDFLIDVLPWSLSGEPREQRIYVLALACLALGTLLCAAALRIAVLDVLAVAVAACAPPSGRSRGARQRRRCLAPLDRPEGGAHAARGVPGQRPDLRRPRRAAGGGPGGLPHLAPLAGAMTLEAVLWDMDGLLVDTEPLWTLAEQELAVRLGGAFTADLKAAIVGTRLDVAVPLFLEHLGHEVTPEAVRESAGWLLARMVELFERPLPLQPGAAALLKAVDDAGVPQALVSSSFRVLVDAVLAHGAGPFATTLAGDEVVRGKPDPEPYLTAAARLGVDPVRCVVLEDSPAGVASGEAAGCAVVAVPSVAGVVFEPGERRLVSVQLTGVGVAGLRALVG